MPLGVGRGQNVGLREFCLILTLLPPGASVFHKHMSSFSSIRGFYVLILNQWLLMSNNHEKSRIQVRISTVIRFRVINLNFSCRFCLILQTYHRISSVWSSISIFTSKVITFGLTSFVRTDKFAPLSVIWNDWHPKKDFKNSDRVRCTKMGGTHKSVYLRNDIKSVHCALCASKIEKSKLTECILDKKTAQRRQ